LIGYGARAGADDSAVYLNVYLNVEQAEECTDALGEKRGKKTTAAHFLPEWKLV
jgi:hypothetical protein